ncbi:EAL domain-containing protein [Leptothoe sp. EHU-05/26/07-4]|uniref:GGDEF domain-containing response regulator n=1 Tax=Adonisia turfae CCMR0081 TaxID=2292702 RepID=A0A6M0RP56_9CYAN|nr:EAL domain-containing protein [Adonisia turfae]NEZ57670.1 GGDEF domain-containing response regulator [Adonisia turfae CCMR0081]
MKIPIILVVDDEPNNFEVIEALLATENYELQSATSGKEALGILPSVQPDLILLDIAMPEMDGLAVCQKIKAMPQWQSIPIIIVTAVTGKLVLAKCLETGADDFISKPVSGLELRARVRSMLRIRQQHQQLSAFNTHLEATVQERTEQLQTMIAQDSLTKLPSRTNLLEKLAECLDRKDSTLAVIILDCDQFHLVNGSFGHVFGDKLLVAIAQRLLKKIRPSHILARLGEDEFCWVVNPISEANATAIDSVIQTISNSFHQPFLVEGCEIYMTASVGIAFSQEPCQTAAQLLQAADTAMYQAKLRGKGSVQIFSPQMHVQIHDRLTLEADLQRALNNQEFTAFYQPIIHLETLKIVGFEALIRWQHPEKGILPPGLFIPSIEASGLIEPVGILIFQKACQQLQVWQQRGWPELTMSINVSPRQFNSPNLLDSIDQVLAETQVNPACLKLEITESAIMGSIDNATALTKELQARQMQVSIDDFGTGYSSLKYLNCFLVNNLKIDRSFIKEFTSERNHYPIVNTIVALAQELGLSIIAEGIETQQQLLWLQNLKCDFGQGYFFSKPLPASEIEKVYLNRDSD